MLVIAQSQQMDLCNVFTYSLGPVPWSTAAAEGLPIKMEKAKLLHWLEGNTPPASSVHLFDGMALLQSLRYVPAIFQGVSEQVFSQLTSSFRTGAT